MFSSGPDGISSRMFNYRLIYVNHLEKLPLKAHLEKKGLRRKLSHLRGPAIKLQLK